MPGTRQPMFFRGSNVPLMTTSLSPSPSPFLPISLPHFGEQKERWRRGSLLRQSNGAIAMITPHQPTPYLSLIGCCVCTRTHLRTHADARAQRSSLDGQIKRRRWRRSLKRMDNGRRGRKGGATAYPMAPVTVAYPNSDHRAAAFEMKLSSFQPPLPSQSSNGALLISS
ncbi:hypothetical protein TSMEX_010665 [Taenia solium]|eukprot:TsM_001202000 transcript=TsM_001202000 gene=TsM_001202000